MAGGASGEAVKSGSPDQSLLYKVTTHQVEPKMPPRGPKIPDADEVVAGQILEAVVRCADHLIGHRHTVALVDRPVN